MSRKQKQVVREGICPICLKQLDKWNGEEFCYNCGYKKVSKSKSRLGQI